MKKLQPEVSSGAAKTSQQSSPPLLKINELSFSYADDPVLRQVSLDLRAGEWVGVIGPNGSGKSTLIKLMGGLLKSSSNSVLFREQDIQRYSRGELAKQIAWVPQETSTPFSFTAYEMVMMGRHPYLKAFRFESGEDHAICEINKNQ